MNQGVILVSILMLIATGGTLAQTPNQDPTIADLQRQIQEMRAQMAKMQNRIAELETTRGSTAATSSSDPALHESETLRQKPFSYNPTKRRATKNRHHSILKGSL